MVKKLVLSFFCFLFVVFLSIAARAEDKFTFSDYKDKSKIAYSIYGQGSTALVFIHGWSCDSYFWRKQVPYFEKKYRVITIDIAGHGKSDSRRMVYSMASFGDDVSSVVNAEKISKVILIGHSMGGAVIVEAAAKLKGKVIGIIGVDTFQDLDQWFTPVQLREMMQPMREDFKTNADKFVRSMFVKDTNPDLVNEVASKMGQANPSIALNAMEQYGSGSFIITAEKLTVPAWSLNADFWPTNIEGNQKHFKSYDAQIIPGVGHFLMLEIPDKFNKELESVIKKIEKSK